MVMVNLTMIDIAMVDNRSIGESMELSGFCPKHLCHSRRFNVIERKRLVTCTNRELNDSKQTP